MAAEDYLGDVVGMGDDTTEAETLGRIAQCGDPKCQWCSEAVAFYPHGLMGAPCPRAIYMLTGDLGMLLP